MQPHYIQLGRIINSFFPLFILAVILLLSVPVQSFAQKNSGVVTGKVSDGKQALPGVNITVTNETADIGTVSDYEGNFTLNNLPTGKIKISFTYLGFHKKEVEIDLQENTSVKLGDIILEEEENKLGEVTISGSYKEGSDIKSINMVKTSPMAVNVMSSDMIKRLPDKNAADALKRMNSTNVQSNKGEGNYVSFRGTPNEWTSTLMNGNPLPVADEENTSRAFDYEVLPSDMIQYIIVARTITPDMEGDNIGGSINIMSKSAVENRTISLNAGTGYAAQVRKPIYNLDFTYGDRSKNKKFGFIINTAYYGRSYGAQAQKLIFGYNTNQGISSLHLKNYSGMRNTIGANVGLEYNINDNIKINGRFIYSTMLDDKYQDKIIFGYSEGSGSRVRLQNIHGKLIRQLMGGELSASFKLSPKLKLEFSATSYESKFNYGNVPFDNKDPRSSSNGYYYVEFASPLVGFRDVDCIDYYGNPVDCNNSQKVITKLIEGDNPYGKGDNHEQIIPKPVYYDVFTGDSVLRDNQFTFYKAYAELNKTYERDPITIRTDLNYRLNNKLSFDFGLKMRMKSGERNVSIATWEQDVSGKRPESYSLTDFNTQPFIGKSGFLSEYGNPYNQFNYPFLTEQSLSGFINKLGDTLREYKMDQYNNEFLYWVGNSYKYKENIYAGYTMFTAKPSKKISMIGGLRLEYTYSKTTADTLTDRTSSYIAVFGNDTTIKYYNIPESRRVVNQYLSLLPSLNLTYHINDASNLRFGISRSMHRPNFNELKPGDFVFKLEEQEITYGNPKLKPTYAWNFDLIYEYFFGTKGIVSLGLYYKYIKDHIFAYSGSGDATYSGIVIRRFENVNKSYVVGLEMQFERKLDFLPKGLDGLGIGVNATYTYSRMQVPGRDKKQSMTEQTPWLINAKLFYEKYGLNLSLAFNYTGRYLHELNLYQVKNANGTILQQRNSAYDIFHDRLFSLDVQAGYNFKKHYSVYGQFNNLLNQPHRMYRGEVFRTYYVEYYKFKFQIGFKYNL